MRNHLRILTIILMLLTISLTTPSISLAQSNTTITVSPDSGVVGSATMDISISGLIPEQIYMVEFVFDGVVVYSTDEEADDDGNVIFTISSTEDDEPGTYTAQVIFNNSIIASTDFEFTEGDDDSSESDDTTVRLGLVSVSPRSGPIGTLHTITVNNLDEETDYTFAITASDTEEVVYRRVLTTDEDGVLSVEIFAREGDTTGLHIVNVFDNSGNLVAEGQFTIEAPPDRNVAVDISSVTGQAGDQFEISVSGLAPFDRVRVEINSPDNELIDTILARASSEGIADLTFLSADDLEDGTYDVVIFVEDEQMAETTLTIGEPSSVEEVDSTPTVLDVTLVVAPEAGPLGSTHIMTVTGLEPEQAITLTIANADGDVEYTTTRIADEAGEYTINITSSETDEVGTYPVEISDATTGQILASAQMVIIEGDTSESTASDSIEQADTPTISVSPESGEIGVTHEISLSGMPTESSIGVVIRSQRDDALAESSVVAIDSTGSARLEFTSSELNIPGVYTVTAVQPSGDLASTTLVIEGAVATIEPQSGVQGSVHTITVIDLNPNEAVTVDVMFDGESVFSSDEVADKDGVVTLELMTDETDAPGDYTITVMRESGNQPGVILTVTEAEETDETPDETTSDDSSPAEVIEGSLEDGIASIEFDGEEGQYVIIRVESDDFDTVATVYDHDFFEIAYNDDSLGQTNSQIGPLLLPYTGEYTLEVSSSLYVEAGVVDGDFVATIESVTIGSIDFDEPLSFSLSPATPALYFELPVEAGDNISITTDSDGSLDTVLQVLYSDGFEFGYDDDSGAGFDAELNNLIFDFEDTYILVVSSFVEGAVGEGTLTVSRNPIKSLDDGDYVINLSDKQYRDLVVFEAEEGQLITLNLEKLSGDVEDLYVYANVDGMQVMSYTTMGVPDQLPLTFVMPMSGEVVVTFEEFGFGSGISLNVSVEKE